VTALSAQILRLDQLLRRYGPETGPARETRIGAVGGLVHISPQPMRHAVNTLQTERGAEAYE
jgi:hypothetical protein